MWDDTHDKIVQWVEIESHELLNSFNKEKERNNKDDNED